MNIQYSKGIFSKILMAVIVVVTMNSQLFSRSLYEGLTECGIGYSISKDGKDVSSAKTSALLLNIFLPYSSSSATTSSSMSPGSCGTYEAKTAVFIHKSYDLLEQEIASGKGNYFDALSMVSQTSKVDIRKAFASIASLSSYGSLSKTKKSELLYNAILN